MAGRWSEAAQYIIAAQRKWMSSPGCRHLGMGAAKVHAVRTALCEIEALAGGRLVGFLPLILERHFMMQAGFEHARSGWEHPSSDHSDARKKRYTTEGIRRDLRKIQTAATRGHRHKVEAALMETSHTVRGYLSRELVVEQNASALMRKPASDIAKACGVALNSSSVKKQPRGRRVSEPDDALLLGVVHAYEALSGNRAARWIDFEDRASPVLQVLALVFALTGTRAPGLKMLKKRWSALQPKRGAPLRKSRFGPAVMFARKKS
jgi:hypothetical protein